MGLIDDVRALGVGAPLRAGYEASKRFGGHDVVFGRLARRPVSARRMRLLPVPGDIPAEVAEPTLAHARRIAGGQVEIFSRSISVGAVPNWHGAIVDGSTWPAIPWWSIDIRSDSRVADVKWAWELGRFRHVVILARGCHLAPHDTELVDALRTHLVSFLDQNPFEVGVHWYSNLELALRAFALAQVLSLAEAALGPELVDRVSGLLWHTGRHLLADLPYTISTMRNNHLLGDGVGMVVVGQLFADTAFGRRLRVAGDRLVGRFLAHASRPDGSLIEDSVSYHRFVVELLTARVLAGDATADIRSLLARSAQFLARLGTLNGPVPQYGDWDEGRALVTADDPCRLEGSVLTALAVCGTGAPAAWRTMFDEVAWYAPVGEPIEPESAVEDGRALGGGLARTSAGPFTVYLKTAAGRSHNHADAASITVRHGDHWVIGDPGTGTYNGPIDVRNWFRGSSAHPVLRVADTDQLEPLRAFRWKHTARGAIGRPVTADPVKVIWCWHDAYTRLAPPVRVARVAVVRPDGVYVADWLDRAAPIDLSWPLGPDATWRPAAGLEMSTVPALRLDVPDGSSVMRGESEPFDAWWSTTYGSWVPSDVVRWSGSGPGPHVWSVQDVGGFPASVDGDTLVVADVRVRVEFVPGLVRMHVTLGGRSHTVEERLP